MSCYPVTFQDLSYHQSAIARQFACPVRTGGRAYVTAVSRGEYERAYLIARETNPFASTYGWVCGAQCEAACREMIVASLVDLSLERTGDRQEGVYYG